MGKDKGFYVKNRRLGTSCTLFVHICQRSAVYTTKYAKQITMTMESVQIYIH